MIFPGVIPTTLPIPDIHKLPTLLMPEQLTAQGMEPRPHLIWICILGGPQDLWVVRVVKEGPRCRALTDLHPLAEEVDLHLPAVRLAVTRVAVLLLPPWGEPQGPIPEATARCTNLSCDFFD